jgi:hypothetical protein
VDWLLPVLAFALTTSVQMNVHQWLIRRDMAKEVMAREAEIDFLRQHVPQAIALQAQVGAAAQGV